MDDRKWERYAMLGGLAGASFMIVAAFIQGLRPSAGDPSSEFVAFYADGSSRIPLSAFLAGLGILALVWWFGSLWRAMRRAEDGPPRLAVTAFGGLIISGGLFAVAIAVSSTTAMQIEILGEASEYFYGLSAVLLGMAAFGNAAFTAAVSALAIRTRFLPPVIAWTGGVLAVAWLVSGYAAASNHDFFDRLSLLTFLVWLIWIGALSVDLFLKADAEANR
jgi:hypothetical protein